MVKMMRFCVKENLKQQVYDTKEAFFASLINLLELCEVRIEHPHIKTLKSTKNQVLVIIKRLIGIENDKKCNITYVLPNLELIRYACDTYRKLRPSSIKIGIALGGGGARGSLQLGQLKALEENNILSMYDSMCGTSIGAINMISYINFGLDRTIEIWKDNLQKMIFKRNGFKDSFCVLYSSSKSIFSAK